MIDWILRSFGMAGCVVLIWFDGFLTNIQRIHKINANHRDDLETLLLGIHIQ